MKKFNEEKFRAKEFAKQTIKKKKARIREEVRKDISMKEKQKRKLKFKTDAGTFFQKKGKKKLRDII